MIIKKCSVFFECRVFVAKWLYISKVYFNSIFCNLNGDYVRPDLDSALEKV